jgi:hypothetical protein
MRSRWRVFAFALVFIAAVIAGLSWHSHANAKSEAAVLAEDLPLEITAYVKNPKASISLELDIDSIDEQLIATLYVKRSLNSDVLLTSTLPTHGATAGAAPFVKVPADGHGAQQATYASFVTAREFSHQDANYGYEAGRFLLAPASLKNRNGVIAALLPKIGDHTTYTQQVPGVVSTGRTGADVFLYPNFTLPAGDIYSQQPAAYGASNSKPIEELFWEPPTMSTSEVLNDIGPDLLNANIQVNLPSNGTAEGANFAWTGSFGLSPVLRTSDRDAEDRRSRNEFYSGIALATAAAALIALIQELPDRFSLRRKRPSPPDTKEG